MEPNIYVTNDETLNHQLIDPDALFIVNRLSDAGHQAYLVGGCIRDLLSNRKPKDFDISTSASPEETKQVFRKNCLLIGRRFRLAHVRFGKKIFEVSTFRSGSEDDELILRDNVWGTPEEDARRRDFTINGLFYDPTHRTVIDYVGGWEDIQKRTLRSIGNPHVRFKQDPVRMIRLLKFNARYGFHIDPDALSALRECREEINKSAPARVLEELLRMLESGAAAQFFRLMSENALFETLFPSLDHALTGPLGSEIYRYLETIDQIHMRNVNIVLDRPLLIASLLFPLLEKEIDTQFTAQQKIPRFHDITHLTWSIIQGVITASFTHFPKRLSSQTAHILSTQFRLTPVFNKRSQKPRVIGDKEFHQSLRFLKIRALIHPDLKETYFTWEKIFKHQRPPVHDRRPHPHRPTRRLRHAKP